MTRERFSLSLEELILSFYVMGCQQAAAEILGMSIGPLSDEELGIRMLTAGHSLAARDWLAVDEEAGTNELNERLQQALHPLADAQVSLRLSKWEQGQEFVLGIHVAVPWMTAHAVEKGIVHRVEPLPDHEALIQCVEEFFAIPEVELLDPHRPVTLQQFEQLSSHEQTEELAILLSESGIEEPLSRHLAQDLQRADWWSVMGIGYTEEREPFSEAGFLMLQGEGRFWLFRELVGEGEDACTIEPGSREVLRREVLQLLHLPVGAP